MTRSISFSPNVITHDINDNFIFAYHSLYGNGRIIDKEIFNKLCKVKSKSIDEIEMIDEEIDFYEFIDLKFLNFDDENEREFLNQELLERRKKLSTGCFYERLHLSTTNKCNMNCKYCFCNTFNFNQTSTNIRFPKEQMSFSVAKEALEKSINILKNNGKDYISVEFFGGEPLLNPELIKKVLEYFGNGDKYNIRIEYGCTSNGTYIPDDLLDVLKKYNVRVALSIDYIDKKSNEFRGNGSNNYKWSDIEKNIKKLIDNNIKVKFQSVLSEETWDKYSFELIDYASNMNIKDIGLILSFDFDFFDKFSSENISKRVLELFDYAKQKDVSLGGYWYQSFWGILNPDLWKERRAWKSCPTIGRLLSVETNGDVYACKTTNKKLGNISEFEEIFKNENYEYYAMRAYSNSEKCIGCELEGFCSGSCTGAIENKYKNIYSADEGYCKTIKLIVKGLLNRHFNEISEKLNNIDELMV